MANTLFHDSIFLAAALGVAGFAASASASAGFDAGSTFDRGFATVLHEALASGPLAMAEGVGFSSAIIDAPGAVGVSERPLLYAAADCSGAAAQAAADTGGQVLSVSSRQQGGQTVCVVTVLVPGEGGARPRKRTITIPQ